MKHYSLLLPDGSRADITNKIYGRKRSIRLFFFKIRSKRTLIAYSVRVQSKHQVHYTIYKTRRTGCWTKGGKRDYGYFGRTDIQRTLEIKTAIDNFESATSPWAYRELFW